MILIIQHIGTEGPGLIANFLKESHVDFETRELWRGEKLPDSMKDIDAAIIMGGPMNVYQEQEYPFLARENEFIQQLAQADKAILGVCLGAQLIAKAFGGVVKKAKKEEIGWYSLPLSCTAILDPFFKGLDSVVNVFQWHGDAFEVPKNGKLLIESDVCPQAFKIGRKIYGLQFHFEVTPDMVETWMPGSDVIKKTQALYASYKVQASIMVRNFVKVIYGF